jgi:Protein of unknown function (DUF664)
MTSETSPANVPVRSFGWSDMFVDPAEDPRADGGFDNNERAMLVGDGRHNGHADLLRERIDGRVGQ